jgi:DNA-binding response OmpR family regulator
MTRILIVGDSTSGSNALRTALAPYGYNLVLTTSVGVAMGEMRRGKADLMIVDVAEAKFDGYRLVREAREINSVTPIFLVNISCDEDAKVRALRLGADDYLSRPVGANEFIARVEALLRRSQRPVGQFRQHLEPTVIRFGNVEVNLSSLQVSKNGKPLSLRPKEVDLLVALIQREGTLVSRKELLERVWGYELDVKSRTVDNHIAKLRRHLEDKPAAPSHIISVRKKGYRFQS